MIHNLLCSALLLTVLITPARAGTNGNIVFARQYGASEITPDKNIVWNYDAPPNTEIHSAYPLGPTSVLLVQNGDPATLLVVRKRDKYVEHQLVLPTKSSSTHEQFVERALGVAQGNKSKAAEVLGIHRRLLYEKLRQYSIEAKEL